MIKTGTYAALIKGVSQQTPQEREDGQLSVQTNMLSDIVNGLRRRSGTKVQAVLDVTPDSYFNVLQLNGEYYIQAVEKDGTLNVYRLKDGVIVHTSNIPYLVHTNKASIRSTITRNQCFLLNTEKIPTKVTVSASTIPPKDSVENNTFAWVYYTAGTYNVSNSVNTRDTVSIRTVGIPNIDLTWLYFGNNVTVAPKERAKIIYDQAVASTLFNTHYNISVSGDTLSIWGKNPTTAKVVVTATNTRGDAVTYSDNTTVFNRANVPSTLDAAYTGYFVLLNTVPQSTIIYDGTRKVWRTPNEDITDTNPMKYGWVRIMTGAFSKQYSITIAQGTNPVLTFSVTTHASTATGATAEHVATELETQMNDSAQFNSYYSVLREGAILVITADSAANQVVVTNTGGDTYITSSNASNTTNRNLLPPLLPNALDGYIMSVGSGDNLAYYRYNFSTRNWSEVGVFEPRYTIQNTPVFWYFDYGLEAAIVDTLDIQGRNAGNETNNPLPKFLDYGITGISSYQSRLVLLSGSDVYLSKSSDPSVFMRTTVTELLDSDPVEVSATSLSNAQFEYAVPYNKDLIVIAQNQQAVIPNSSTVLTPKTAAIYPTTNTDISLACQPTVIARSLYYVYQRDLDYYQVGEFQHSPYTDSQYTTQSTTDHLPLYAASVCNCMSGSTASNVACFTSDTEEVLINQFYWRGDERPLMSYHKWILPRNVVLNAQVSSSMLFLVADGTKTVVINTDIQLNQLQTKPIPYLDLYQYVTITDGVGVKPTYLPDGDLVAVIYDNVNNRHSEVAYSIEGDQVLCKYNGVIAIGLRYMSEFTLTPPYLRDGNGNVVAGSKTTLQSLNFTTRGTGKFSYSAVDAYGGIEDSETSGATWSEVDLGYTWIGSVSNNIVTCRSKLNSTRVTLRTDSTTDLNITMAEYNLRIPDREVKRRR